MRASGQEQRQEFGRWDKRSHQSRAFIIKATRNKYITGSKCGVTSDSVLRAADEIEAGGLLIV